MSPTKSPAAEAAQRAHAAKLRLQVRRQRPIRILTQHASRQHHLADEAEVAAAVEIGAIRRALVAGIAAGLGRTGSGPLPKSRCSQLARAYTALRASTGSTRVSKITSPLDLRELVGDAFERRALPARRRADPQHARELVLAARRRRARDRRAGRRRD